MKKPQNIESLLLKKAPQNPQNLEGIEPSEFSKKVREYKGKEYHITKHWHFLSLEGKLMKTFYHENKRGQRVRIKREFQYPDGSWDTKYEEVWILQAMSALFWPHFPGYQQARKNPKAFMLVPKDGNYENMDRSNLEYVSKKVYLEKGSKRETIKKVLLEGEEHNLKKLIWISQPHIRRVREELREEGKIDAEQAEKRRKFKEEHGIECAFEHFPIYELFLQTQGKLTNLEMAKLLFLEDFQKAKSNPEKKKLTAPIVRIRKRLQDQEKLPRDLFQEKREEAIKMIEMKAQTGYTNQQIAELLSLKKEQIDNLARQIKKSKLSR